MKNKHIIELRENEADDFVTILLDGKYIENGWNDGYCEHISEVLDVLEEICKRINGEPFEIVRIKEESNWEEEDDDDE